MALGEVEWTWVRCLVVDHLVNTADPYQQLALYFPDDVSHWRVTQVATQNADIVISAAKQSALADDQPLSIRLLKQLVRLDSIRLQKPEDLRRLNQYIGQLMAEKAALKNENHFDVIVIPWSGEAFIDRAPIRGSLRQLVEPDRKPEPVVLCVTGDKDSGKSFTYRLIKHLAEPYRFIPLRVILQRSTTAEDVLRDFSVYITRERRPLYVTDPAKRLRYWASWLVEEARDAFPNQPCWFVIDQGNELDPDSDAVEFIAHLAQTISEVDTLPNSRRNRLVLLGWNADIAKLALPGKQVLPQHVSPIREPELREFFEQSLQPPPIGASRTTKVGDQLAYVEVAVRHVIDGAESAKNQGSCYMRALALATQEVLDEYAPV